MAEAKRLLQTEIPWICDAMDNQVKQAVGGAPNGEIVVDPDGKVVRKRFWSNPETLRADLVELVGPVDQITTVDELPARLIVEPRTIASGVVPRIELPGGLAPLTSQPQPDEENPFFAKLRIEATRALWQPDEGEDGEVQSAAGQMYLGLYLDPLYKVHWNNRAGNVAIQIDGPEGMTFSETELSGPDVEEDADVDPRQFLIDVEGESTDPINVSVTYTVCDDAETFCHTITQNYEVRLEPDRNLGSRPGIFMPQMFAEVKQFDENGDGDLTPDELPEGQVTLYVGHMDFDGNGIIEKAEIEHFMSMFNNGRGFDSSANDGG